MTESIDELKQGLTEVMREIWLMRPAAESIPAGVTPAEFHVLLGIRIDEKNDRPARSSVIAAKLNVTKSAFSQTLKSLEGKGLVSKSRSKEDSRGIDLALTEAGQAVMKEAEARGKEFSEGLLAYIGEEDLEHLLHTTRKVLDYQRQRGFQRVDAKGGESGPCA